MKIDVKKNGETILHREDAKSITDKGGAYEIAYADGEGQVVFKGENVAKFRFTEKRTVNGVLAL